MSLQGYVIVFGSLAVIIALIVGGAFVGGPWGRVALVVGILGAAAVVIFIFIYWLDSILRT